MNQVTATDPHQEENSANKLLEESTCFFEVYK